MTKYKQNIVLDLEFTPVPTAVAKRKFKNEIIQIGAARVSPKGAILDCFSSFVKPEFAKTVSREVRALTGIGIGALRNEDTLGIVLRRFRNWVGQDTTRFVTWSMTDLRQLKIETLKKELVFPECNERWLDLQKIYPRIMKVGNGKQMSLHAAADWCGIKVSEKDIHGALYDAKLTAQLLQNLITHDYKKQAQSLFSNIANPQELKTETFTIGDKFSSLLMLKAKLELQESDNQQDT